MSPALRKTLLVGLGAAVLTAWPLSQAAAATATTTFSVTADVLTNCTITATNMAFGAYSGVQLDATATLTATCSAGTAYEIGLNAGAGTGANTTTRKMTGPAPSDHLNYTLSQDSAHSINWGDVIGTDTLLGLSTTGAPQPHTVFGRIAAGQFNTPGQYSDTIAVTLTF